MASVERTPRHPHTCTKHPAGTYACYTVHRCRCTNCRGCAARYQNMRRMYGPDLIDAAEAREHARKLSCVMTREQIVEATGYARPSLKRLLNGTTKRIRPATAEKILSVPTTVTPERRADVVLSEVLHLLGTDSPGHIAQRLGYSQPKNLARLLERHNRRDLAVMFDRAAVA
jgi:hypothetical protein